jgi:hypothetical protein
MRVSRKGGQRGLLADVVLRVRSAGDHRQMSSILADNSVLVYEPKCGGGGGVRGLRHLSQ